MRPDYPTLDRAVLRERESFRSYLDAIGERVGHGATLDEARAACPDEFAGWRKAFAAAYCRDPDDEGMD